MAVPLNRVASCQHRANGGGARLVDILVGSGVPWWTAIHLECRDVHRMALLIARSGYWAKGERTLIAELPDRPLPTPSWLSMHRGLVIYAAYIVAWLILLFAVWRIA